MPTFICPYCGKQHNTTSKFCPTTGKAIRPTGASVQVNPILPNAPGAGMTGLLPPNSILHSKYLILKKIGQGGMAAVYQVTDTGRQGQVWAVKEMSDTSIPDPRDRNSAILNFQKEASVLKTLNHPNLPKVSDTFTDNGKHYLVMEFIDGQTLDDKLAARCGAPFTEQEVLPWAIQLCRVLTYLHSHNPPIIFRDLKPGNIMLDRKGLIKLIDFGIVRFFDPKKTKDTMNLGTVGFSSPEATSSQTDARSDIYSLCVTLHQLLTGFDPSTSPLLIPPARQINPALSKDIEHILARGMEIKADKRWQTTSELRKQFEKLLQPQSTQGGRILKTIAISKGNPYSGPSVSGKGAASRPTTRLIQAAAQLSPAQLGLALGGIVVGLVALTWILTPILEKTKFNWNLVPFMAIFGALGYAAYPKRWVAFLSHSVLSGVMVATIWARTNRGFGWPWLIAGAIVSGLLMEAWVHFLPAIKRTGQADPWKREVLWLSGMSVLGIIALLLIISKATTGYNPIQWLFAALLGAAGWFLGDMVNQYILFRRVGLHRNSP